MEIGFKLRKALPVERFGRVLLIHLLNYRVIEDS